MMETTIQNETLNDLLAILGIDNHRMLPALRSIAENHTKYLRDLKINVGNVLKLETLTEKEKMLLAYAVAVNERNEVLQASFSIKAAEAGASPEELAETVACVSLLQVNNVFYRFRHFAKKEVYEKTPAGIKMSIMMSPLLGKEFFELLSLCISALNGCELCVSAHEESVLKHGGTEQRIFDAVRFTAVMKGLVSLI